jgi:hypothetical protein
VFDGRPIVGSTQSALVVGEYDGAVLVAEGSRGCLTGLSTTRDATAEITRISITSSSRPSAGCGADLVRGLADDARSDQWADHDEQAGEEQQHLPFDAAQVALVGILEIGASTPAPSSAATAGSSPDGECPTNPVNTVSMTTPHLISRGVLDGLAVVQWSC